MPKVQYARTGMAIERRLYLHAQKHAAALNQSFAAYVVDLIAADVMNHADVIGIPDVERVRRLKKLQDEGVTETLGARMLAETGMSPAELSSVLKSLAPKKTHCPGQRRPQPQQKK